MLPVYIVVLAALAFILGRVKAVRVASHLGGVRHLHSLPNYYGWFVMWVVILPVISFCMLWMVSEHWIIRHLTLSHFNLLFPLDNTGIQEDLLYAQIVAGLSGDKLSSPFYGALVQAQDYYRELEMENDKFFSIGLVLLVSFLIFVGVSQVKPYFRARPKVEKVVRWLLILCSSIAILTTLGIVLSVLFESIRFFSMIPVNEFLFGTHWSPQIAIRADQQGASGAFGAVPLFVGTLLVTLIAMLVAAPIGLFSAIYLAEYASEKTRAYVKPIMEILAGIPTVVYGFIAALMIAPAIRSAAEALGSESVSSESALAAGLVMGVMIIPFVSSLSDDVIRAVPQSIRDASLAMGATQSETIKNVVLPAALPGIVGGLLLAVSRAIGETMIVVMAAGLSANMTFNPLESVTTITVQIVTLLVGDQEFDSTKTLAAFALGLTLFVVTLILNVIALRIVKKYREHYE